jgi:hypothetical protein
MKITIRNRFDDSIILEGEYDSIKDALEKNKDSFITKLEAERY